MSALLLFLLCATSCLAQSPFDPLNYLKASSFKVVIDEAVNRGGKYMVNYFVNELTSQLPQTTNQKANRLAPKEYDFVIKIPSILDIQHGYCIKVAPDARSAIFGKDSDGTNAARFERVIAVVGYYSKGKTFLVNQLFNAMQAKAHTSPWTFWNMFGGSGEAAALRVGHGVTTEGFSGIAVGYADDMSQAKALLVDCAGRNAPGTFSNADASDKKKHILNEIDDMRAKERLMDDVIQTESDFILYVVDELLNEDQRVLLDLIDKLRDSSEKRLIVIHNFKRLNHNDPLIKEFIISQIEKPFGATRISDARLHAKQVDLSKRFEYGFWESNWMVESSRINVKHVALFKHEGVNLNVNQEAFKYLVDFVLEDRGSTKVRRPIMEHFSFWIDYFMNQFVTVSGNKITNTSHKTGSQLLPVLKCNPSMGETHSITSETFSGADKNLQIRHWDLIASAPGNLWGDYTPTYSVKEFRADNGDYVLIRVDFPGMIEAKNTAEYDANVGKKSVFIIDGRRTIAGDDTHFMYKISGHRINTYNHDDTKQFGKFALRLKILNKYKGGIYESSFTNGELVVKITEQKDPVEDEL